jgi:hypothetical protein
MRTGAAVLAVLLAALWLSEWRYAVTGFVLMVIVIVVAAMVQGAAKDAP